MGCSEKRIEQVLVQKVKQRGGLAMKFVSPGLTGVPDRIVLLPHGQMTFVELKAEGKKLRPLQEKRKLTLEGLGFQVYVIDNIQMIGGILDAIQAT